MKKIVVTLIIITTISLFGCGALTFLFINKNNESLDIANQLNQSKKEYEQAKRDYDQITNEYYDLKDDLKSKERYINSLEQYKPVNYTLPSTELVESQTGITVYGHKQMEEYNKAKQNDSSEKTFNYITKPNIINTLLNDKYFKNKCYVIINVEQLKEVCKDEELLSKYNEEYFKNNNLIYYINDIGNGDDKYTDFKFLKKGDTVICSYNFNIFKSEVKTMMVQQYDFIIEVDKDVTKVGENITKVGYDS